MAEIHSKLNIPPDLQMPEHDEPAEAWWAIHDTFRRIRKRFGLLDRWLKLLYFAFNKQALDLDLSPFRWIWHTASPGINAGVNTVLTTPPEYTLEDTEFHIVYARGWFQFHGVGYTITPDNTMTFTPGVPEGELISIYALKHNDIQEAYQYQEPVGASPWAHSPPVTVDRAAGRQLVFAETSPRFLDSGRGGDEYNVDDVDNEIQFPVPGLGPNMWFALFRLMEAGCLWHEEIIADADGQLTFAPVNLDNRLVLHDPGKLMVFTRVVFRQPGSEFTVDTIGNTLTLTTGPGLLAGHPLNIFCYR